MHFERGGKMTKGTRKFVITIVFTLLFVSIAFTQSKTALGQSSDFISDALKDYEQALSSMNTDDDEVFSETVSQLIQERQAFYKTYFSEGLHSTLINIDSEFDQSTINVSSSGKLEIFEYVHLTGISKLQTAEDYPAYQAALVAMNSIGDSDKDLTIELEQYAKDILEGVQQSIDEGEFTITIINKHQMIVDWKNETILADTFSSEANDDSGLDKIVLIDGKPHRVEPDLTLLPDNKLYATSIDVLAKDLLESFSSDSVYQDKTTDQKSVLAYSGNSAAAYIRTWVRNTSTTCGSGVYQDQTYWNPSYTKYWCADCANYVSQALAYGGMATTPTWQPYTYAWVNVSGLSNYIISQDLGNFQSCSLLGLGDLGFIPRQHVVMVSRLNPLQYSAHTSDRLNYTWQPSLTTCINVH